MHKNGSFIDLHIHTFNSDGHYSPKEVVKIAKQNNTNFIAISDHDTIKGLSEFENNLEREMIGVDGVEFSSYIIHDNKKVKLHILGYGFDKNNPKLLSLLNEMKDKRINAHLNLLKMMREKITKFPESNISKIDIERYCWFDREIIKCLEDANYPIDIIEYYKDYFRCNKFSYGSEYDLDAKRVIDAIKSANGFVVLAHPMVYKISRDDITKIIIKLTKMGLDGIEIYQSDCSYEDSIYLKKLADSYNLLASVGSDFHRNVNSDGRIIGKGINQNLCIEETSLTRRILEKKKYFNGVR